MAADQDVPHTIDLRGQDDLLYIPIGFVEYGGRGAVREVCELILSAQGALDAALERYLA